MQTPPSITFALAVYNVSAYLDECLASVLAAAQRQDEILVVNDGSTDDSPARLEAWMGRYPGRIRRIDKANGGLSSARNAALPQARGDYLLFVDGDDALDPDAVARARAELARHQPDILVTDFAYWPDDGRGALLPSPVRTHAAGVLTTDPPRQLREMLDDMIPCVWSRFFRRSLFDALPQAPFPEWSMYDDLPTTPHLVALARSQFYLQVPLVKYRQRATSLTRLRSPRSCTDLVRAAVQATAAVDRLPPDESLALQADILLARKLMEAIRQTREVPQVSASLLRELITTGTSALRHPAMTVASALARSPRTGDRAVGAHLLRGSRWPGAYALLQASLSRFKQRRGSRA